MSAPTLSVRRARVPHHANGSSQRSECHKPSTNYLFILLCVMTISSLPTVSLGEDGHDGHHGVGHDSWHESFYSTLIRKDTKTSCCNLSDCRPTQSRMVNDHYEVKVDGAWLQVPKEAIQNVAAPDGGAHVCAPAQIGAAKGKIYCVVLPPET
jgi:hypothetical protein